jgi:oxygen-independent coproporphyrinogen-3 oxidase
VLDDGQRRTERIMLGLRLDEGLPSTDEGGPMLDPDAVRSLVEDGLIEADGTRVRLTDRGRLLADHVIRRLL